MARDAKGPIDVPLVPKELPLTGRLITYVDPSQVPEEHFTKIENLRYVPGGVEQVKGMERINTTTLSAYPVIKSGYNFLKNQPEENHVYVQAFNSAETQSQIFEILYDTTTDVPTQKDFETVALYTETAGASRGIWTDAPDGSVAYSNGKETLLLSGKEWRVGEFIVESSDGSFRYNFTDQVRNTINNAANSAILYRNPGGFDAYTVLDLHLDNDVTDATARHTPANTDVTFTDADAVLGSYSALFNGTTSVITTAASVDFALNSGFWTLEGRVKCDSSVTADGDYCIMSQQEEVYKSAYTSGGGTYTLLVGDIVTGASSGQTGYVSGFTTASGIWGSGTATGNIWISQKSGAFTPGETLNVGAHTDVLTLTADPVGDGYDGYGLFWNLASGVSSLIFKWWKSHVNTHETTQMKSTALSKGTWYGWAVAQSGQNFYLFINGALNQQTYTVKAIPYVHWGSLLVGTQAGYGYFKGGMDEIRISTVTRYATSYTLATSPFGNTTFTIWYVGSSRPLIGIKVYMGSTVNTSASTTIGFEWHLGGWVSLTSLVDGTASSGVTLAKTGIISFTSTIDTSKARVWNGQLLYWYRFESSGCDDQITIYNVTVNPGVQKVRDLWGGDVALPKCVPFYASSTGTYQDFIYAVRTDSWDSSDTATYVNFGGMTSSDALYAGYIDRQTAILIHMVGDYVNTNATVMTLQYFDGKSWQVVSDFVDGTSVGGVSFAQSGVISWTAPDENVEHETTIANDIQLFYYKITFSATLSKDAWIYFMGGIPVPLTLHNYNFCMTWQDRLLLCGDRDDKKYSLLGSEMQTTNVFNGSEYFYYEFGSDGELVAGANIFSRYGGTLSESAVICKKTETWILDGIAPNITKFCVAHDVGCSAASTLRACDTGYEIAPGINKHVAIWQSATGIVMFDINSVMCISYPEIHNLFNMDSTDHINPAMADQSDAFYDPINKEYHWLFASGTSTTLNREFVYNLIDKKWFEINRVGTVTVGGLPQPG